MEPFIPIFLLASPSFPLGPSPIVPCYDVMSECADQVALARVCARAGVWARAEEAGLADDNIQDLPAGKFQSLTQVGLGEGGGSVSCLSFAAHA